MKIISFIFAVLLLTGCSNTTVLKKTDVVKLKIVDIDPPKHFKIIVMTDEGKKTIPISKRCSVKSGLVGSYTNIQRKEYYDSRTKQTWFSYSQFESKSAYCK